jgi:L-amino acid N-acyltransferase YncA
MVIRPFIIDDAKHILNLYRYYIIHTTITFEEDVPRLEDFKRRIEKIAAQYPYIVAEVNDEIAGFAYATVFRNRSAYRWVVEVALYVDIRHQGRGIGKKLLGELLDILTKLGYYDAYAVITLPNDRSVALFESFGFTKNTILKKAGYKNGTWCDAGIWEKDLQERNDNPGEPLSFHDFLDKNKKIKS